MWKRTRHGNRLCVFALMVLCIASTDIGSFDAETNVEAGASEIKYSEPSVASHASNRVLRSRIISKIDLKRSDRRLAGETNPESMNSSQSSTSAETTSAESKPVNASQVPTLNSSSDSSSDSYDKSIMEEKPSGLLGSGPVIMLMAAGIVLFLIAILYICCSRTKNTRITSKYSSQQEPLGSADDKFSSSFRVMESTPIVSDHCTQPQSRIQRSTTSKVSKGPNVPGLQLDGSSSNCKEVDTFSPHATECNGIDDLSIPYFERESEVLTDSNSNALSFIKRISKQSPNSLSTPLSGYLDTYTNVVTSRHTRGLSKSAGPDMDDSTKLSSPTVARSFVKHLDRNGATSVSFIAAKNSSCNERLDYISDLNFDDRLDIVLHSDSLVEQKVFDASMLESSPTQEVRDSISSSLTQSFATCDLASSAYFIRTRPCPDDQAADKEKSAVEQALRASLIERVLVEDRESYEL